MNIRKIRVQALLAGGVLAGALGLGLSQPGSAYPGTTTPGTAPEVSTTDEPSLKSTNADLPPNVKPGWKIRVCSEKTKADKIQFKFTQAESKKTKEKTGMGRNDKANDQASASNEDMTAWNKGENTEISVPSGLREVEKLRIEAVPSAKDKEAQICVLYNDHVAKKLKFDDREISTVKATENGECGC
jgi:hypothetical protein